MVWDYVFSDIRIENPIKRHKDYFNSVESDHTPTTIATTSNDCFVNVMFLSVALL